MTISLWYGRDYFGGKLTVVSTLCRAQANSGAGNRQCKKAHTTEVDGVPLCGTHAKKAKQEGIFKPKGWKP